MSPKIKPKGDRRDQKSYCRRLLIQASGANSEPVRSRRDRPWQGEQETEKVDVGAHQPDQDPKFLAPNPSVLDSHAQALLSKSPPSSLLDSGKQVSSCNQEHSEVPSDVQNAATVTDGRERKAQGTMNANGTYPSHRHHQPPFQPKSQRNHADNMPTSLPSSVHGPMLGHIQVAKPFVFQQAIDGCLSNLGVAQAREDTIRLAGIQWIDNVRKALKLPVRTFDTAAVYYHKFRLSHADNEYSFVDAAAAALFAACKIEDTLKKSRDILCAAHNLKLSSRSDHLSSDDPIFEPQSRAIIGLERLMLEASSFDFRNRHPQHLLIKIAKRYGYERHSAITKTAYNIGLDLYRTFAPLKQSTPTMAFACLELAGKLHGQEKEAIRDGRDYPRWNVDRAMVMETLLDLLELYTHYRDKTTVGPEFPRDTFIEIQIPLNEELNTRRLPRYTEHVDTKREHGGYAIAATNGVLPSPNGMGMNGRLKASPSSPATPSPGTPGIRQKAGERGKEGTVRFMLNPDRERDEKVITVQYAPLLASMRR